jgi:hypothetical protein
MGTGIFGTLKKHSCFFTKVKVKPTGQILIDSSDIIYMFDEDEDSASQYQLISYYGELEFTLSYKGQTEDTWL